MIWQHKIELFIFISSAWMHGEAGGDSPSIAPAHNMQGKKFLGVGPFSACNLKRTSFIKKETGAF